MALAALAGATPASAQDCREGAGARTFQLQTYRANITTFPPIESVRAGDLVEFNPGSMRDQVSYIRAVHAKGALPEWYWIGVNCYKGRDCNALGSAGVDVGSTGTAEWNREEARVEHLDQPAVIARAEREMERALRAAAKAGSNLAFRIDNMHDLNDRHFYDRDHVRSFEELRVLTDAWARVVRRLREAGTLAPAAIVGLTAHNNFAFWQRHIADGGAPPLLLRIENPTQFPVDLANGIEVMRRHAIPLVGVEFREGHRYKPTPEGLKRVAAQVSFLVVMENEDNYQDGRVTRGPGPDLIRGNGPPCPPAGTGSR